MELDIFDGVPRMTAFEYPNTSKAIRVNDTEYLSAVIAELMKKYGTRGTNPPT
jgi:hypothetical protein